MPQMSGRKLADVLQPQRPSMRGQPIALRRSLEQM
jgi:hypothetical protein